MKAATTRKLEARARVRLGYSSKWDRFWQRSRVTAEAGWGAFVVTGVVETVQALLKGEGSAWTGPSAEHSRMASARWPSPRSRAPS